MVKETRDLIDRLCVRCYYDQSHLAPLQGMPYKLGESIERLKKMIDQHCGDRDVKVFLSEWNPECSTDVAGNMGQALEAAQIFHMMERKSAEGSLDMATPCQLCVHVDRYRADWLRSAPVQINNYTAWTSPMYHVNALYSRLREHYLLDCSSADIPTVQSQIFDGCTFPALDVVVTRGESKNRIVIKAANNSDRNQEVAFTLRSSGTIKRVKATTVAAKSIFARNTAGSPNEVVPEEAEVKAVGAEFSWSFRPGSVTAFEVTIENLASGAVE
ncbi:MAG: alpha-L-arabinofuranosidase C-terminal domain-containing protein [Spirochaetia bacterium]